MTSRFILLMLTLAAVLAGVVFWAGRKTAPSPQLTALVAAEPTAIDRIDFRWSSDGSLAASAVRNADGLWVMQWKSGATNASWPLLGSRVMSATRLLAAVKGSSPREQEPLSDPSWITLHAGSQITELAAAKRSFGGRGLLVLGGDAATPNLNADVDGELVQVFQRPDVLAWRDMSLFPAEMSGASRIELTSDARTTRLARVGGKWALVEPARVRADVSQVEGMLAAFKKLRVARFPADQPGWTPPESSAPPRRIVVETDRRTPDGGPDARWVVRQELVIRSGSGSAEDAAVAEATVSTVRPSGQTTVLWGPTVVMVDAASLNEVLRAPESLAARTATAVVAADVRGFDLSSTGATIQARRSIDRWNDHSGTELSLVQREAARTILELLTSEPAIRVELSPEQLAGSDAWTARLLGADGPPLAEPKVWVRAGSSGMRELAIENDGVVRVYSPDAAAKWEEAIAGLLKP